MEEHQERTIVLDIPIRGGEERSPDLYRWLLATFTDDSDYVLDVFSRCGGLGKACGEVYRYYLCLEGDDIVYEECLKKVVCGPYAEKRV
ncbi:hypothetical protein GOP47_0000980 [Adiantum capillus-veneris]|uniref:Uncharacterized protein n=1 Tax=Adiantum capillus-veneris TaxID=13818 RepID=A0A9D4VE00_ADICA|nr:hypothetical protein GOP47_0000980 [Adiantum capillus-veneris]